MTRLELAIIYLLEDNKYHSPGDNPRVFDTNRVFKTNNIILHKRFILEDKGLTLCDRYAHETDWHKMPIMPWNQIERIDHENDKINLKNGTIVSV